MMKRERYTKIISYICLVSACVGMLIASGCGPGGILPPPSSPEEWAGVIIGVLIMAIITGFVGHARGYNFLAAFFASLVSGPIALLFFIIRPAKKRCPQCQEKIQRKAKVCKHCGHKLQ